MPGAQDTATIPASSLAQPLTVTVDDHKSVGGLTLGANDTLQIVNNPANPDSATASFLTVTGTADIFGMVQANSNVTDPVVAFVLATVTVEVGGKIEAHGLPGECDLLGRHG